MQCPRCETEAMDEVTRDAVVIDVCRACRGIFLDRGELEKLIGRSRDDYDRLAARRHRDSDPPSSDHHGRHRKKSSWFDIFD